MEPKIEGVWVVENRNDSFYILLNAASLANPFPVIFKAISRMSKVGRLNLGIRVLPLFRNNDFINLTIQDNIGHTIESNDFRFQIDKKNK